MCALFPAGFSGTKEKSQYECPTALEIRAEEVGAVGTYAVGYREGC